MAALATDVRAATAGLLLTSETDAPLQPLRWPIAAPVSEAALRAYLSLPDAIPVEARPAAEFFARHTEEKDWFGPEERAIAQRFAALAALLPDALAFRVGPGPDIAVYVLGPDPDGGWTGFASHVTET